MLQTLRSTWINGQSQIYKGNGVFTFTYDDATAADNTPGKYTNAVKSATFAFDNTTLSLKPGQKNNNTIRIFVTNGAGINAQIVLDLLDANGISYQLDMRFTDSEKKCADYALSNSQNLIGLFTGEDATFLWNNDQPITAGEAALYQKSALVGVPSAAPSPPTIGVSVVNS